jgi:hypothetical protein
LTQRALERQLRMILEAYRPAPARLFPRSTGGSPCRWSAAAAFRQPPTNAASATTEHSRAPRPVGCFCSATGPTTPPMSPTNTQRRRAHRDSLSPTHPVSCWHRHRRAAAGHARDNTPPQPEVDNGSQPSPFPAQTSSPRFRNGRPRGPPPRSVPCSLGQTTSTSPTSSTPSRRCSAGNCSRSSR